MPEDEKPVVTPDNNQNDESVDVRLGGDMEPATQNQDWQQPVTQDQPLAPPVVKKSKKKWIIGGIATLIVALVGGGAVAYFAWYQSPQKVLSDAFINLFADKYQAGTTTAKASVKNDQVDVTINLDGKSTKEQAEISAKVDVAIKEGVSEPLNFSVNTDVFVDSKDKTFYIKIKDAKALSDKIIDVVIDSQLEQASVYSTQKPTEKEIAQLKQQLTKSLTKSLDPIIKKIDNQWIKAKIDDSEASKQQECQADVYSKLQSSSDMQNQLLNVYAKNAFLDVKETLPVENGNIGYVLELNQEKAKEFGKQLEETELAKELEKCDDSSANSFETDRQTSPFETESKNDNPDLKNTRLEVRIGQWSHALQSISFSGSIEQDSEKVEISMELSRDYKDVGTLVAPKDAVDIKDLQQDLGTMVPFGPSSTPTVPYPAQPTTAFGPTSI